MVANIEILFGIKYSSLTFPYSRFLTLIKLLTLFEDVVQKYDQKSKFLKRSCKPIYNPRQNYESYFDQTIDPYGYNCYGNIHCSRRKKLSQITPIFKDKMLPEG